MHNFSSYNSQVMQAWNRHDFEEANAMQLKQIDVIKAWTKITGAANCQKSILKITGIDFGPLRAPQDNPTHEQEIELASGKIPNLMGMKFTDEHLMEVNAAGAFRNRKYNMLIGRDEMLTSTLIYNNGQGNIGSMHNFSS